jgi:hypothetical protein
MKKMLVFLCIVFWPLSSMALVEETDETLSDVTGQAGVSINPNFTVDISIDTIAWGDKTGVDASTAGGWTQSGTAGYVGITGLNLTGLTVSNQAGVAGVNYKPMTIDIGTGGAHGAGVTFMRFGIGSLKLTMPSQDINIAMGADPSSLNQVLGKYYLNLTALEFDPKSYVDIYAGASGCGVNIAENLVIKDLQLKTVSWGDTDGISGVTGSSAGYVGIANLQLTTANKPITVTGTMSINIGSNSAYPDAGTILRIGYTESDFTLNIAGPITGDVMLDSTRSLNSTNAKSLGDIYISSCKSVIKKDGVIDIWAH